MVTKEQKRNIEKFFQALDKISHPPGDLYDLGLIISDIIKAKNLINLAPYPEKVRVFSLSEKIHPDEFLKQLVECFKNKKWLLVELKDGYLPGRIYNQLRLLSIQNRLQISDLIGKEKEIIDLEMPKESRIVFLTSQESLSKIGNPNLIKLFGPIVKI